MIERYDLVIVGGGTGAFAAGCRAAKLGLSVGYAGQDRGEGPARYGDAYGLLYRAPLEDVLGEFPEDTRTVAKVVEHRLLLPSNGSGVTTSFRSKERAEHPDAYIIERRAFDTWLAARATAAGMKRVDIGRATSLRYDRKGQLAALEGAAGAHVRCRAVIVAGGGENLIADSLKGDEPPEPARLVKACQTFELDAEKLYDRFDLLADEAVTMRMIGAFTGEYPGHSWLHTVNQGIHLCVAFVVPGYANAAQAEAQAKDFLKHLAGHASVRPLLRGARGGIVSAFQRSLPGYNALPHLYGDGWLLLGESSKLADPMRPEFLQNDLTAGKCAAEAVARALPAGDTSARPLSVYRHMLNDSYVIKNLKAQRNAVQALERKPALMSDYAEFMNRWFAHDTEHTLEPRKERNREFFQKLRNDHPVWEFALGARRSLKMLRD